MSLDDYTEYVNGLTSLDELDYEFNEWDLPILDVTLKDGYLELNSKMLVDVRPFHKKVYVKGNDTSLISICNQSTIDELTLDGISALYTHEALRVGKLLISSSKFNTHKTDYSAMKVRRSESGELIEMNNLSLSKGTLIYTVGSEIFIDVYGFYTNQVVTLQMGIENLIDKVPNIMDILNAKLSNP